MNRDYRIYIWISAQQSASRDSAFQQEGSKDYRFFNCILSLLYNSNIKHECNYHTYFKATYIIF